MCFRTALTLILEPSSAICGRAVGPRCGHEDTSRVLFRPQRGAVRLSPVLDAAEPPPPQGVSGGRERQGFYGVIRHTDSRCAVGGSPPKGLPVRTRNASFLSNLMFDIDVKGREERSGSAPPRPHATGPFHEAIGQSPKVCFTIPPWDEDDMRLHRNFPAAATPDQKCSSARSRR